MNNAVDNNKRFYIIGKPLSLDKNIVTQNKLDRRKECYKIWGRWETLFKHVSESINIYLIRLLSCLHTLKVILDWCYHKNDLLVEYITKYLLRYLDFQKGGEWKGHQILVRVRKNIFYKVAPFCNGWQRILSTLLSLGCKYHRTAYLIIHHPDKWRSTSLNHCGKL